MDDDELLLIDQQTASLTTNETSSAYFSEDHDAHDHSGNEELVSHDPPPELQSIRSFSSLDWGDPITWFWLYDRITTKYN